MRCNGKSGTPTRANWSASAPNWKICWAMRPRLSALGRVCNGSNAPCRRWKKWRQGATRQAALQDQIAAHQSQLETLDARLGELRAAEDAARERADGERAELDAADDQLKTALLLGAELGPQEAQIAQLEKARRQVRQLAVAIARLPADAGARAGQLAAQVEALEGWRAALPHFKIFVGARQKWRAARAEIAALETQNSARAEVLTRVTKELHRSQSEYLEVQERLQSARDDLTRAGSALDNARAAQERFAQVEGQSQCTVCQQPLTPSHAAREAARLEAEVGEAARAFQAAQKRPKSCAFPSQSR